VVRGGKEANEFVERRSRLLGGMDPGTPFVQGRGVDTAKFEPSGDVFQGDTKIVRMGGDVRGDSLPMKGAVFTAEMVIVLNWDEILPLVRGYCFPTMISSHQ
jgi:hypothetical protein